MAIAYVAERIFTGDEWLQKHAVLAERGIIQSITPAASIHPGTEIKEWQHCVLAPAFIDLQIYGAYGKLLSVYPQPDSLVLLKEYCEKGGAAFCMPTVATNTREVFFNAIDAVRKYMEQGGEGILGLHLEGPWINEVKRGAHIQSLIHSPAVAEVKELLEYGKGIIKIITLAPEVCDKEIIDIILSYDIIISAGHSNATYDEAIKGFDNGITAVTHLYNAMSPLQHRQPGLAGAAMNHATAMSSIIPDGHHVDFAAISIAKKVMKERLFVITDAVTETPSGAYPHYLVGDKYEAGGILSGSALTMDKAVKNLVTKVGIEPGEAIRMCSLYPSKVVKLDDQLGRIKTGYAAKIVVLDKDLTAVALIR